MTKKEFAARWQQLKDFDKKMRDTEGGIVIRSFKSDKQVLRHTKERMFLHFVLNEIADNHHIRNLDRNLATLKAELACAKDEIKELKSEIAVYQSSGDFQVRRTLETLLIGGVKPEWMLQEIQELQQFLEKEKSQLAGQQ